MNETNTEAPAKAKCAGDLENNVDFLSRLILTEDRRKLAFEVNALRILCKKHRECPVPEFLDFIYQAQLLGADPGLRQIMLAMYFSKKEQRQIATVMFSYHFFMAKAQATGEVDVPPTYQVSQEQYFNPVLCRTEDTIVARAQVKRKSHSDKTTYTAWWPEYVQMTGYNQDTVAPNWKRMPHVMLGKCSIVGAVRYAFPDVLGNMYVEEEIGNMDKLTLDVKAEPAVKQLEADTRETIDLSTVRRAFAEAPAGAAAVTVASKTPPVTVAAPVPRPGPGATVPKGPVAKRTPAPREDGPNYEPPPPHGDDDGPAVGGLGL